jgi:hypothetical protein
MHQIVETIEAEVRSRPSPLEFEMAYQARVAMDRIKFAIKHAEQFSKPCIHMRDASLQLLDALERLESLDRRFQIRSRIAVDRSGTASEAKALKWRFRCFGENPVIMELNCARAKEVRSEPCG